MAKKKKFPKAPKANASLDVWNRYKEKVNQVKKDNAQMESDKAKKKRLIADVKKLKTK